MLVLLAGIWVMGRAALWESPFPLPSVPDSASLFAANKTTQDAPAKNPHAVSLDRLANAELQFEDLAKSRLAAPLLPFQRRDFARFGDPPAVAAGHQFLIAAAFKSDWHSTGLGALFDAGRQSKVTPVTRTGIPPFAAPARQASSTEPDRWSFDAYAYYRAGSDSLSPAQGRTPVYGASQLAANLQYRVAPRSGRDPRAYLRAYHALVSDAETELAPGISARPIGGFPVRVAGELRITRNLFSTDVRPAGYAVTEFPAQRLPLRFSLETYGAAGYVGGEAETYFVDGQASLTRELGSLAGPNGQRMRFSLGGATWGGVQEDAGRLDIGPTLRLDLSVGEVPARVSVDWRERVAGDAAPDSGVAATVSTRF